MVCRKRKSNQRAALDPTKAFDKAVHKSLLQVKKFSDNQRRLSRNDIKIIVLANMLVYLSPGRNEAALINDFESITSGLESVIEALHDQMINIETDRETTKKKQ